MSAREFAEWIAYTQFAPFGSTREDQRAGTIASALINIHLKRGAKLVQWSDFFPTYEDRHKPALDWRDMLTKVESLNDAFGGVDTRNDKKRQLD